MHLWPSLSFVTSEASGVIPRSERLTLAQQERMANEAPAQNVADVLS